MDQIRIKNQVREFWSQNPCGSATTDQQENSKEFYEGIEAFRYKNEPQIFSFAQFTRYHGKKVLEVGVGMGTDFLQWVRAGAKAYGVDLTDTAIQHVQNRLYLYGLTAEELKVADAESLPYPDDHFDLVYSWGVLMHTPDMVKALEEVIRVTKPAGDIKLMVYNRYSLACFYLWLKHALLKGRPWKTLSWCLFHFQESKGTKAYTVKEIKALLKKDSIRDLRVATHLTYADTLQNSLKRHVRWFGALMSHLLPFSSLGWFMTVQFRKHGTNK